jgi:hypothetical protein
METMIIVYILPLALFNISAMFMLYTLVKSKWALCPVLNKKIFIKIKFLIVNTKMKLN